MPLAYRLMLEDGGYDSMVVFQSAAGLSARGPELVQQAVDMRAKYPDRVIAVSSLFTPELHQKLDEGQVLAFADPARAVRAIAALAIVCGRWPRQLQRRPRCRKSTCRAAR